MSIKKNKLIFVFILIVHALWMMFLSYLWVNTAYSYESESKIMAFTSILKNVTLRMDNKPSKDSLLFINISYDKMLLSLYDSNGFESGKIAVTDRAALIKFIETINLNPNYKFILLDIFFEDSTSFDSLLLANLQKTRGLILPYHLDGGDIPLKSHIKNWSGLADYNSDFGNFLKYSYLQKDTCRTVPLLLYEKYNDGYINKWGPFYTSQGSLALNAVALDFPIRSYDIFTDDSIGYNSTNLYELINLPGPFIKDLTKNKIIIIGDFKDRDIHPTLYGNMAGPLIQLNAYLTLASGGHLLSWSLMIFIFINYIIISWFLFSGKVLIQNKWIEKIQRSKMGIVYDFFKYAFFLILINIFSYLVFDVHLNVLLIGIYIVAVEYILIWINSFSDKKI